MKNVLSLKNSIFTIASKFFPKNLGSVSDELREHFHQNLKSNEENQFFWNKICWSTFRETVTNQYERIGNLHFFLNLFMY